jgi:hypothetical protein
LLADRLAAIVPSNEERLPFLVYTRLHFINNKTGYQDLDGTFGKSLSHHSVTLGNGLKSGMLLRAGS